MRNIAAKKRARTADLVSYCLFATDLKNAASFRSSQPVPILKRDFAIRRSVGQLPAPVITSPKRTQWVPSNFASCICRIG